MITETMTVGEVATAFPSSVRIRQRHGLDQPLKDWTREPLHALIDHIITTYHDVLRQELPRLATLSSQVQHAHGAKADGIRGLHAIVTELSAELLDHIRKEELVLFPAIREVEAGATSREAWIIPPMTALGQDHERAVVLLKELRRITNDYGAPAWACPTVAALYDGLADLEAAMHVHEHLEDNVLFPRALHLANPLDA